MKNKDEGYFSSLTRKSGLKALTVSFVLACIGIPLYLSNPLGLKLICTIVINSAVAIFLCIAVVTLIINEKD